MSRLIFIMAFTVSVSPIDAKQFTDQEKDLFVHQIDFIRNIMYVEQKIKDHARLTDGKEIEAGIEEAVELLDKACGIDLECPAAVHKVKEFCDKTRPEILGLKRIVGAEYKKECDRIAKQLKVTIKALPDRALKLCSSELGAVAKIYEKALKIFPSASSLGPADIINALRPVVGGFDGFVKLLNGKGGTGFDYVMTLIDMASSTLGVGAEVLNVATDAAKGGMGGVGNLLSGLLETVLGLVTNLLKGLLASISGILGGLGS